MNSPKQLGIEMGGAKAPLFFVVSRELYGAFMGQAIKYLHSQTQRYPALFACL